MTMSEAYYKHPRIYCDQALSKHRSISLTKRQAHYFCNVMRRKNGDIIRIFNENDGEWIGALQNLSKKSGNVSIQDQIRPIKEENLRIHLFFTPLSKNRMDWLIEKATELGVYSLHPVLTQNTEIRKIKNDRIRAQIIEAAEQCERLRIPRLFDLQTFEVALQNWEEVHHDGDILACLERSDTKPITNSKQEAGDIAILIGPPGGFTAEEKITLLGNDAVTPVSLGETILRAETAALSALSILRS